jgi:hypothetical protein
LLNFHIQKKSCVDLDEIRYDDIEDITKEEVEEIVLSELVYVGNLLISCSDKN